MKVRSSPPGRRRRPSRRRSAAPEPAGASARRRARFCASVASRPGEPRRAHAGRAAERRGLDPRVVGDRRAARAPRRPRAPCRARSPRSSPRPRAAARHRPGSGSSATPGISRASSATLWSLRVARTSRNVPLPDRGRLRGPELVDPVCASASSSSRWARDSGVRSAVAWTSTQPAVAGHHDVGVDLRGGVLGVVEVEQRRRRRRSRTRRRRSVPVSGTDASAPSPTSRRSASASAT